MSRLPLGDVAVDVNDENGDLVIGIVVNVHADAGSEVLGQLVVRIIGINQIASTVSSKGSGHLALAPVILIKDEGQFNVTEAVASYAFAGIGVHEQNGGVLAVNDAPSIDDITGTIGLVNAVCGGATEGLQRNIAAVRIEGLDVIVTFLSGAEGVNISQGVAGAGVGEDGALLQAVGSAVVGGHGNGLRTIPSLDHVYGAVRGAGALFDICNHNCIVVGVAAGAGTTQV